MVFTSWPSGMTVSVVQDFTALPSRWTTQAPHCEVSQPTWVPVSRRCSRRNCTSRVRGSIFAVTGLPFTIRETLAISTLLICAPHIGDAAVKSISSHHMGPSGNEQPHHGWARYDLWPVSHVLYPLIPRSRASGVTRDEASSGASWFETAHSRLLTMRVTS